MRFAFLRQAPRWLFIAALAYAPCAWGATTPPTIATMNALLAVVLALWIVDLVVNRRWPRFPPLLFCFLVLLLILGSWMAINGSGIWDAEFSAYVPVAKLAPQLPGSVEYALSVAMMVRVALLLGIVLFVVDLAQSDRWLLRLWYAIGAIGASVALIGLLQKATGAKMVFWQRAPWHGSKNFFATYYYHANAGAYLNIILPAVIGLALRAFSTPGRPWSRALWLTASVITLMAVVANTSRMSQAIAAALVAAIAWTLGPKILRQLSRAEKNVALGGAAAIVVALVAVAQATHLEQPLQRWQGGNVSADTRWVAATVAIQSLRKASLFGFGPGAFRAAFPSLNVEAGNVAPGDWRFLHQDYLQTLLEWGWLGGLLWAALFFGAIVVAIRKYRSSESRTWAPRRRLLVLLSVLALGGVALHAFVDYPLQIASIQLYVATFAGVCWSTAISARVQRRRQRPVAERPVR